MSSSHSYTPAATPPATARRRRPLLVAAVVAAVFVIGAGIAAACIPWTGKFELENISREGDERGAEVYGADHSDVAKDGTQNADRGNGQGMVWCDEDDPNGFGQQYKWAVVHPDSGDDITLTVDDNNDHLNGNGETKSSDDTGGCDSDLYLPEDEYSITFDEDSFDNEDDSTANGEETYADNHESDSNGGSAEVGTVGQSSHCMDNDDDASDDETKGTHEIYWDLTEDEGPGDSKNDGSDAHDDERFPADWSGSSEGHDVIDEGPHSINVDFDDFDYDASESGDDSDEDGHTDAAGICITSHEHYHHDNTGSDNDNDDDVEGGEKDGVTVEYGNAIPVNLLNSV